MQTNQFVIGKEWQILSYYGFERTGNKHINCPICGGDKKFRLNDYNGKPSWICTCGNGDMFSLLMEVSGKDFKTIAAEIDRDFGNEHRPDEIPKKDTSRRDKAIGLFRSLRPVRGSDGEKYLNSRGIYDLPTGGVKFGDVYDHTEGRYIPAMVALASTEFTEPRQMHVTYIENGQKAQITTQRKMHSLAHKDISDQEVQEPIAIKLSQATNVLGIAEGIESALSAKQIYKVPTWAAMNAIYLRRFRAPTGVETLYLFADNDNSLTGIAAAMECARGNLLCSNDVKTVIVRWPETVNDFNDVLADGGNVLEWKGSR